MSMPPNTEVHYLIYTGRLISPSVSYSPIGVRSAIQYMEEDMTPVMEA